MSHSILVSKPALCPAPGEQLSLLDSAAVSELHFCLNCSGHRTRECVWRGGYGLSEHISTAPNLLKCILKVYVVLKW